MFLSKYGAARHIYVPMVKRGVVDHAVSADWTPAAGDVKISKDGGAAANVTNLPTAIAMGNSALWDFSLTATEMQAAQIVVTIADSATKAVEDNGFTIETYGNASAQHAVDLSDSVRAGLTALPNAAAAASGGLVINGSNTGTVTLGALTVTGATTMTGGLTAAITGSITGNLSGSVGSVTGAVGSVTGNVGGNVTGSVGSVVGAVGSVTGAVGSVTAGVTVTTNNDKTGYALTSGERTSVADALLNRDMSAVTVTNSRSPINALRALRNKVSVTAGTVYAEDDATAAWTFTTTVDAAQSPITVIDPA